ncbi:MAG: DUF1559 domain-containing protein [Planctomycetaceae bacterium]
MALHGYEGSHRTLPPGYVSYADYSRIGSLPAEDYDAVTWDAAPGWAWGSMLLGFMEQSSVEDQLDPRQPAWAAVNRATLATQLELFLCPSVNGGDGPFVVVDAGGLPLLKSGGQIRLGRSHYAASHGQEEAWGDLSGPAGGLSGDVSRIADGPFYRNSRTRFRDITDGLSNTILLGEHSSRLSDKTWAAVVPGAFVHPRIHSPENGAESAATITLVHTGPAGELDLFGNPITSILPTFRPCTSDRCIRNTLAVPMVLLGDNVTRFVSEHVDLRTFSAITSIAEGEVVGAY